jgi:hypothetical protein
VSEAVTPENAVEIAEAYALRFPSDFKVAQLIAALVSRVKARETELTLLKEMCQSLEQQRYDLWARVEAREAELVGLTADPNEAIVADELRRIAPNWAARDSGFWGVRAMVLLAALEATADAQIVALLERLLPSMTSISVERGKNARGWLVQGVVGNYYFATGKGSTLREALQALRTAVVEAWPDLEKHPDRMTPEEFEAAYPPSEAAK